MTRLELQAVLSRIRKQREIEEKEQEIKKQKEIESYSDMWNRTTQGTRQFGIGRTQYTPKFRKDKAKRGRIAAELKAAKYQRKNILGL